jgi:hypothetical protein
MTSARDHVDEDIIVVTDAQVVDSPSRGAHAATDTDRETSDDRGAGDLDRHDPLDPPGDEHLASGEHMAGDEELEDDEDLADEDLEDDEELEDDRSLTDVPAHGTAPVASTEPDTVTDSVASTSTAAGTTNAAGTHSAAGTGTAAGTSTAAGTPVADPASSPGIPPAASNPAGSGAAGGGSWPEIQALFVDDPLAAVTAAAQVAGGALNGLMAAARDREQMLRGGWEGDETGTEKLRIALRDYRDLTERLDQIASQL